MKRVDEIEQEITQLQEALRRVGFHSPEGKEIRAALQALHWVRAPKDAITVAPSRWFKAPHG